MGVFNKQHKNLEAGRLVVGILFFCFLTVLMITEDVLGKSGMDTGPDLLRNSKDFEQKLEDKWGIELTALRMTAANRMVDFRYRILDAEKAAPLFKRQTKPYLVHEASGKVLAVPNTAKVGSLRNTNKPKEGRIYWMFFGNQGLVKSGDRVSVVIGDFRADNLVVQ